jgi:tRNA(Ile2) C34 agmatinyltransferase TiaS
MSIYPCCVNCRSIQIVAPQWIIEGTGLFRCRSCGYRWCERVEPRTVERRATDSAVARGEGER